MHAGEEGVAPGRAALLGVIGHEDRAFIADAVDIGRFADHQAAMVDARLHPADVVAHDEHDVGLLRRRCRDGRGSGLRLCGGRERRRHDTEQRGAGGDRAQQQGTGGARWDASPRVYWLVDSVFQQLPSPSVQIMLFRSARSVRGAVPN